VSTPELGCAGQHRRSSRQFRVKTALGRRLQQERDTGQRSGPTTTEDERIKALEREVRELRKANEILRLASAFFAQAELDRRFKS
jgi:transposase-like protein